MTSEKETNNDIYFDRSRYGSRAVTLKDARAKDKSITALPKKMLKSFLKNIEVKKKPSGYNSFVAPQKDGIETA